MGVRNGCFIAAADINAVLAVEGNVCQKGDVKNAFQSSDRATTYDYILDSPPPVRCYASLWFVLYGLISIVILCTWTVACGFVALFSAVGVAQGCTYGSDFFAFAIQAAANEVNTTYPNQITRFIVDDVVIAGAIVAVALAMALWITLSFALGLVWHPDKRVLVRGSAAMEEAVSGLPPGPPVAEGTIFKGYPIANVSTPGGKA